MREMLVYLVGIAGILFAIFLGNFIKNERFRKFFIVVPVVLYFIAVSSLKNSSVGIDTKVYHDMYVLAGQQSWSELTISNFEPGYVVITKIFAKANIPFNGFLLAAYSFVFTAIGYFVFMNSKNVGLSLLIYMCFLFFTLSLTGLRQTIAISMVLVAYEVLKIKNPITSFVLFIAIVGIAATFHTSAFVVLPMFFFRKHKLSSSSFYGGIILFILVYLYKDSIFSFITLDVYDVGAPVAYSFSGLLTIVVIFCLFGYIFGKNNVLVEKLNQVFFKLEARLKALFKLKGKETIVKKEEKSAYRNDFTTITVFFGVLASLLSSATTMARIHSFFYIFILILIPNTIAFQKSKLLRFCAICCAVGFFVGYYYMYDLRIGKYDIVPYKFFWE